MRSKKIRVLLCLLLSVALALVAGWIVRKRWSSQSSDASKIVAVCEKYSFDPELWCRSKRQFQDHAAQASREAIALGLLDGIGPVSTTTLNEVESISTSAQALLVHVLAMQERKERTHHEAVRYCLRSPVVEVRKHAVEAVGLERLQSYDSEIRSSLVDTAPEVRAEAVETATRFQWPDINLLLEHSRKDPDSQVRRAALQGLIIWDRVRAMELLEEVNRKDPDERMRSWAHEALKVLGSHDDDLPTQEERNAIQKGSTRVPKR